ncbi:MAG: hypothetical protein CMI16_05755 [Opitutaceae bacterium]|nr:hypothetical protein [Opitutaceae bacterium]
MERGGEEANAAPMNLPNLSGLSLKSQSTHAQWLQACGTRPDFKSWESNRAKDKHRLLHSVAETADNDEVEGGSYVSAYEQKDTDVLRNTQQYSVEHVVPRSHVNGNEPGEAEDDPLGWIEATRRANSQRSNSPLYLWCDPKGKIAIPGTKVYVDGELHYVPPFEQRARLARKWLFIRATYPGVSTPTDAQRRHAAEIVALAKYYPAAEAEIKVNEIYRKQLGWANPLLEANPEKWYDDDKWRASIFWSV